MTGNLHLVRGGATAVAWLALATALPSQPPAPPAGSAATAATGSSAAPEAVPVRIQFPPGRSSASVRVDFQSSGEPPSAAPRAGAPPGRSPGASGSGTTALAERRYVLAARAGQTLRVGLRAAAEHRGLELSVLCPGNGHTSVGRQGRLAGSITLPESGDYTILVFKSGAGPMAPAALDVEVTGSPNRIAARPYTGTYYRQDSSGSSIDVQEVLAAARPGGEAEREAPGAAGTVGGARAEPGAARGAGAAGDAGGGAGPRLRFALTALWGALDSPFGPNLGTAQGVVTLQDGVGLYQRDGCRLTFRFGRPGTGELHVDEAGDCGFGHNVTARGDYRRTSLCAAPEAPP